MKDNKLWRLIKKSTLQEPKLNSNYCSSFFDSKLSSYPQCPSISLFQEQFNEELQLMKSNGSRIILDWCIEESTALKRNQNSTIQRDQSINKKNLN